MTPAGPDAQGHYSCGKAQPGDTCQIDITVASATSCAPIQAKVHVPPRVVIKWQIKTTGWKFRAKGIEFKTQGWQSVFANPSGAGSTAFHWHVQNVMPTSTEYDYWVRVERTDGTPCDNDPAIWV